MKKIFIKILVIILSFPLYGQTLKVDSLENLFSITDNDSAKTGILYQIGLEYENYEPNLALTFYRQGLHLAIKNNFQKQEAEGLQNIAIIHDILEKYSSALNLYSKSLKIYENINDTTKIASLNLNIGGVYLSKNILDSALIYTLNAVFYFENLNDTNGIKTAFLTLAAISIDTKNYNQAIYYLNNTLKYTNTEKEPIITCMIYNNYAIIFQHLNQYDKSFKNLEDALKIAIQNNLTIYLPAIYTNLGKTFFLDNQLNQSIIYYYKAKQSCEKINDPIALVEVYTGLAEVYEQKQFQKTALGFLILAKNIIDLNKHNVPIPSQISIYQLLSDIYHDLGDDAIAYKYLFIKENLHDSLIEQEKYKIVSEIETKYQITKKNSEIEDLQSQNNDTIQQLEKTDSEIRAQKRALFTLIILILLILITSIWILKNYLSNKKLNQELEKKNKKILDAQSKVERIVNSLPEIFFETDIKGRIIYTNKNFFSATGYNIDDIKNGLTYYQLIASEDRKKVKTLIKNQFAQKANNPVEITLLKKDKTTFPAYISINIKNIGNTYDFYGVVIDISEKKKTEQELLLLKTSVEQADISVMITNNKGKIVYVNPAFEKTTGYSFGEAIKFTPQILNSGKTSKQVYKEFWDTVLSGKVWRGTFMNKRKNGELFWEKNIVSPLKDKNNNITHYIANKEDITSEVEKNEKIIKLFTATENSPNSVTILDFDKKITYVNAAFEKITGYKSSEIIGVKLDILNSNEHDEEFYYKIWETVHNGKIWQGTVINKRKNGELYWDASTIIPLQSEDNNIIGYVCNDIDITYQVKTQEKLKNTLSQLNEKNEEIYSSLKYAQRIQNALMPDEKHVLELLKNAFVLFLPRDIVSGDFYWTHKSLKENFIAVVDCTGHSVPGAFLSIIGFNLLEASVKEQKIDKPSKILDFIGKRLNILFSKTSRRQTIQDDMEVSIAMINFDEKVVQFASSRNRLYLVREITNNDVYEDFFSLVTVNSSKKILKINGNRQYLAKKKENFSYSNFLFNYSQNDLLYMTTDGYFDQFGDIEDSKFKRVNFEKLLLNISETPIAEQKEILLYKLLKWKGETPQTDDITVVGIKLD
ncbi:MAG: PAS domain S-box protein [Bacteroidales bacterium]|nr:PAS domain S-box protein [Bacteroidales bacterium]